MNDKEAVKVLIAHRIRFMDDCGWDKSTIEALDIAIASLATESEPAVPHEMTAREYITTINRICGIYYVDCEKCPLETENNGKGKPCFILQKENPEVSIAIVKNWARNHADDMCGGKIRNEQ